MATASVHRWPDRATSLREVPWGEALSAAAAALDAASSDKIAVLGGARLTNESAYAWAKLAKGVLGTDNVDAQLGDGLPAEVVLGLPRATIDEVCAPGGTVLLLAPDLKEELPVLFLRLRHAVTRDGVKVVELATHRTSVSELATATLLHRPGAAGDVVRALLAGSANVEVGGVDPDDVASAGALLADGPVTVVLGRPNVAESSDGVVAAAAAIHTAHPDVRFLSALRRGNVHGALDMGLAPGLLPGRVTLDEAGDWFKQRGWPKVPTEVGLDATGILQAAAGGKIDVLVLLGADPLDDFPDTELATRAVAGARTVIAVDRFLTASAQQADVVLAASGPSETDGTTTNVEGRISPVVRKITPPGTARDDWMLAAELSRLLGSDLQVESADQILAEVTAVAPSHAGLTVDAIHGARDGAIVGGHAAEVPVADPTDSGVVPEAGEAAVAAAAADTAGDQQAAEAESTEAQADAEPAASEPRPPVAAAGALGSAAPGVPGTVDRRLAGRGRVLAPPGGEPEAVRPRHRCPALAGPRGSHERHRAATPPARLRSPRGHRRNGGHRHLVQGVGLASRAARRPHRARGGGGHPPPAGAPPWAP